jgi:hypothetical protein
VTAIRDLGFLPIVRGRQVGGIDPPQEGVEMKIIAALIAVASSIPAEAAEKSDIDLVGISSVLAAYIDTCAKENGHLGTR